MFFDLNRHLFQHVFFNRSFLRLFAKARVPPLSVDVVDVMRSRRRRVGYWSRRRRRRRRRKRSLGRGEYFAQGVESAHFVVVVVYVVVGLVIVNRQLQHVGVASPRLLFVTLCGRIKASFVVVVVVVVEDIFQSRQRAVVRLAVRIDERVKREKTCLRVFFEQLFFHSVVHARLVFSILSHSVFPHRFDFRFNANIFVFKVGFANVVG